MARRKNQDNEERVADNPAESAAVLDSHEQSFDADAEQAQREQEAAFAAEFDNDQADISESGDEVSVDEISAANQGRLARGEEPVEPENVEEPAPSHYDENLLLDGVGMDTQAVKQSSVPRIVGGTRLVQRNEVSGEEEEVGSVEPAHPELVEAANTLAEAQENYTRAEAQARSGNANIEE